MTSNKFMLELHLKQPRFTYSACGKFARHRERVQKFRETGILKHLYRNELDKTSLFMMQLILTVKIKLRKLFTLRF